MVGNALRVSGGVDRDLILLVNEFEDIHLWRSSSPHDRDEIDRYGLLGRPCHGGYPTYNSARERAW